jgi:Family of unknown function (DUF5329)
MTLTSARLMVGLLAVALGALATPAAAAGNGTAASPAEIEFLLQAIERSGCDFYRNGSWHTASDARAHLARKYDAVQRQHPMRSADAFIEAIATRSSSTGEPYRVRCPGEPIVDSGAWFRQALASRRQGGAGH